MNDIGAQNITARLRDIANAIEENHTVVPEVLLIGRTAAGEILSEDSGLLCNEAAQLSRDFVTDLVIRHDRYYSRYGPRADYPPRCNGRRVAV